MIQVNGKYNQAIIYTDVVDEASIAQVKELCNQEFSVGQRIRLMPDIHAGAGCTIGTTMTLNNKVVPNLVGVDIGCGMAVAVLKERHIELEKRSTKLSDNTFLQGSKSVMPDIASRMMLNLKICAVQNMSIWTVQPSLSAPWAGEITSSRSTKMMKELCT